MRLLQNIRRGVSVAAAFIMIVAMSARAGDIGGGGIIRNVPEPTEELHFKLGNAESFVVTTTDDPAEAYADIDLMSWWGTPPSTNGLIDEMEVQICFDTTRLRFDVNGSSINTANWHGTYHFDSTMSLCSGGNKTIILTLYYEPGYTRIDTVKTSETVYATLRFVPLCQAEGTRDSLRLASWNCSEELFGDETTYRSLSLEHGWVDVTDDYNGSFVAADVYSECSLLGETIEVPVNATTNFRTRYVRHTLVYDTTYLTFDTALFSTGMMQWAEDIETNLDTIILNIEPASVYIDELPDAEIYRLFFTVTDTTNWNGPNAKANIDFVQSKSGIMVYYVVDFCYELAPTIGFNGAQVWSDNHWAWLQLSTDENDDYLLACNGDDATIVLSMKNSFPAGGAVNGLTITGNTGAGVKFTGLESDFSDGVTFTSGYEGGTDNVDFYFRQTNTGILDCSPTAYGELLRFTIEATDTLPDPSSYANRKLNLQLLASIPSPAYTTQAREAVTGTTYYSGSGVELINGGPEVPAIELTTTSNSTGYARVSSMLRLRNNFNLDSLTVTLGSYSDMTLTCVKPRIYGETITDNGDGTWTVRVPSATELDAGGDAYKEVALLYYEPINCTPCKQQSGWATIAVDAVHYTGTYEYTQFTSHGVVSANCCGAATVNPCEYNGGITKTETGGNTSSLPQQFALLQNHPNPFNPVTVISYDVPKTSHVRIVIYNVLGQQVDELVDRTMAPGRYEAEWDASHLASGVYLYRMEADGFVETKKMLLMK